MYQRYLGLKEKPFRLTPDPRFLYLSEQHAEALDHLTYGISQGEGFMVISGDVGTGKTTIIRSLLERLDDSKIKTALVLNPLLEMEDLLKTILGDFGLIPKGNSKKELIEQLNNFLLTLNQEGGKAVVIIDESQNLTPDLLEELRSLSNLETDQEKLLQIVLVGQLELWAKLNQSRLRQLQQRISVNYRLKPLSLKEMKGYIAHRLAVAGLERDLPFSQWAWRMIYRNSKGIPRLINLICDRTLLSLYIDQTMRVTKTQVRKALESLRGGKQPLSLWRGKTRQRTVFAGAAAMILLAGVLFYWGGWNKTWVSLKSGENPTEVSFEQETGNPSSYTVHLASFRKQRQAEQAIERICRDGLEAFGMVFQYEGIGTWYRVVVGQYEKREEAQGLADHLKANGSYPYSVVIALPQDQPKIKMEKKGPRL